MRCRFALPRALWFVHCGVAIGLIVSTFFDKRPRRLFSKDDMELASTSPSADWIRL